MIDGRQWWSEHVYLFMTLGSCVCPGLVSLRFHSGHGAWLTCGHDRTGSCLLCVCCNPRRTEERTKIQVAHTWSTGHLWVMLVTRVCVCVCVSVTSPHEPDSLVLIQHNAECCEGITHKSHVVLIYLESPLWLRWSRIGDSIFGSSCPHVKVSSWARHLLSPSPLPTGPDG